MIRLWRRPQGKPIPDPAQPSLVQGSSPPSARSTTEEPNTVAGRTSCRSFIHPIHHDIPQVEVKPLNPYRRTSFWLQWHVAPTYRPFHCQQDRVRPEH